jgi:hypothetical protein
VGQALKFTPQDVNTYLSRDGGLSWLEAHKGAFIYEYGDHGGLITMADDLKKTTEVVFTWNEGQSWYDFKVAQTPFEVDNIITDPNWTSTTFVMFGARDEGVGVLYYLKFDALGFPRCKGVWAADSVQSDYETWQPSDGVSNDKCMLGQQMVYTRRKRTSQCWNGEDYERVTTKNICACTQEDFACDMGFVRTIGSTECNYGGPDMLPQSFIPTVCSSTFSLPAYRKIPGDMCEQGWQPTVASVPCPSQLNAGHFKYGLGVLVALGLVYFFYNKVFTSKGSKNPLGDFTAAGGSILSQCGSPLAMLAMCLGCMHRIISSNRGIERFPDLTYKKVSGNEFDLDGLGTGDEESLTEFLDEADHDDFTPHVYGDAETDRPEKTKIVAGSARGANQSVPMLQAPPSGAGGPAKFDVAGGDEDLL